MPLSGVTRESPFNRLSAAGLSATFVGNGIGRFAFIAMMPALIQSGWFSKGEASYLSVATLVGYSASIITPIPENGVGEIAYVQGGSRYTAPARSESNEIVASGRTVKIKRIVGSQVFVEPI